MIIICTFLIFALLIVNSFESLFHFSKVKFKKKKPQHSFTQKEKKDSAMTRACHHDKSRNQHKNHVFLFF